MPTDITTLNAVSRQILIYGGFLLSIMGIFGSNVNIFLLTRARWRRVPCSVFMLVGSIFELIPLCFALLGYRVINQILQYDIARYSIYLCRIRLYIVDASFPIPIWCICLSAFDRWCITSRDAFRRHLCTCKRCRITAGILISISFIYRLPDLFYADIVINNGQASCIVPVSASAYYNIQTYFTFSFLITSIPLILLITLSIGTRINLRSFIAQQAANRMEQQITSMVLLQAIGASCLLPYTVNLFYTAITRQVNKSSYQIAVENLINQICTLGFYAHYATGFYIHLIASPDVRRTVRREWQKIRFSMCARNQIDPTHIQRTAQMEI